jgi:uncharacterized protein (DUF1501 family)
MDRRTFLRQSALASSSLLVPQFLQAHLGLSLENSRSGKILVVVQLSGGNDGLNTVVPYRNDLYYQNRPRLGLKKDEILPIHDEQGLNPGLEGLRSLYDEGLVTILNGVGYPNPDRSHFRSMDIWHSASNSDEYWSTGWLGRYLDSECADAPAHHALEVDDSLSFALQGKERSGFAISDPKKMQKAIGRPLLKAAANHHHDHDHEVDYLYKTLIDTQASADYLAAQSKVYTSRQTYPPSTFGKDLKQIAELITADTDTRIYYLSLSGFDTHVNQKGKQERLLKQYADGMRAFVSDLQQHGLMKDVSILTFSEFGRRVKQNASGGTDHGTANNLFVIGEQLATPGIFNPPPDLARLDQGDLFYQLDFRQIYASVLEQWLGVESHSVLGRKFESLALL